LIYLFLTLFVLGSFCFVAFLFKVDFFLAFVYAGLRDYLTFFVFLLLFSFSLYYL